MDIVPPNSPVARRVAARHNATHTPTQPAQEQPPAKTEQPDMPAWAIMLIGLGSLVVTGKLIQAFPQAACIVMVCASIYFGIKGAQKNERK